jgi:hypothetical protein
VTITRSKGDPIGTTGLRAGGGYQGLTDELDAVVREAARELARAYGSDISIRYNTDRESGGAWLVTPDGWNAHVGICASLVTARQRATWQRWAAERDTDPEWAALAEGWLAESPEGQLTVCAHITAHAAGDRAGELAALYPDAWNDMSGRPSAYHHGPADSVADALARCADFAPSEQMRADAAELASWETDGGA